MSVGLFNKYKDEFLIILLCFISYGLMLLNDGFFWDDWAKFNVDTQVIVKMYSELGSPFKMIFHILLKDKILLYRFITFSAITGSAVLFNYILKSIREISDLDKLVIALLFALYPVNLAKVSITITPHIVCLFLFTLGSYFLLQYIKFKKNIYQLVSLICFFISFEIQSFLPFYSLAFLLIFYHESILSSPRFNIKKLKQYKYFIIIPFVYWGTKLIFFKPYGVREGYNDIKLKSILLSPIYVLMSIYNNIILPITNIKITDESVMLFFTPIMFIFLYLFRLLNKSIGRDEKHNELFLAIGLIMYYMSVLAYMAIGRYGISYGLNYGYEWLARDQLIVPFGASFIVLYGAKFIFQELQLKRRMLNAFLSLLIVLCVFANITNCLRFQRNWFKTLSIIEAFKENDVIKNNTVFVVDDKTEKWNALPGERERDYAYNGMMMAAYNDRHRYAYNLHDYRKVSDSWMTDKRMKPQYKIIIKPLRNKLRLSSILRILATKLFSGKQYKDEINSIVTVKTERIQIENGIIQ